MINKKFYLIFTTVAAILLISATIDLNNLLNYQAQTKPAYITKDNTAGNAITNGGAILGRVLFYDKKMSVNNTIACASCHKQQFAFGDNALQSTGVAGLTGRHSMRLVNARFSTETKFFWDERAATLEAQTTMPIKDHTEMGWSGANGDPGIDSLIRKLENIPYYDTLFTLAYGSTTITEAKIQDALAQFVRSIQSFDSKFDTGLAAVNGNLGANFPNFTAAENAGKALFLAPPGPGNNGAGCQGCHRAPEFDIDPASLNNNIIGNLASPGTNDITVRRSPTLRDMVNPSGQLNGPLMHDGSKATLLDVINHYNVITFNAATNNQLDNRLKGPPPGLGQNLNLTQAQKDNLVAFLSTLTGNNVYTDERWSNPFNANGTLTIVPLVQLPYVQIDGKFKVMMMDTITSGEYVVVRQADGTLALRRNKLTVSATGDTLYNGAGWVIIPGISGAN
jgi:cytochrome c peroxidase